MPSEYIDPDEFSQMLDSATSERELLSYFSKHPHAIYWTFCNQGGHCRYAFKEFPLGNSYVADFVLLNSYSGVWEVNFVELEPANTKVFTKTGVPANRLSGAVKQIDDWLEYFDKHKEQVRADLVRWTKDKDILGYSKGGRPSNFSGNLLADPATYLRTNAYVLIGRRDDLTPEEHTRKGRFSDRHNVEVATYDRVLDLIKMRYKDKSYWMRVEQEKNG